MTTYETLLPEVLPYAPGCPDLTAINAIRNAAIELCSRSRIWQVLSGEDFLGEEEEEFQPDTPKQGELVSVEEVWVGGSPVEPMAPDLVRGFVMSATVWPTATGRPRSYFQQGSGIRFVPLPDENLAIVTRCSFRPTRDSTEIEDWLYNDWYMVLAAGALARLLTLPGQSWTNEKSALMYASSFARGVSAAKIQANRGRSRAELRIELPRFV